MDFFRLIKHLAQVKFSKCPNYQPYLEDQTKSQAWGLGFDLVSLVPCLGDALGVVGVKKVKLTLTAMSGR